MAISAYSAYHGVSASEIPGATQATAYDPTQETLRRLRNRAALYSFWSFKY